jgi:cation transport regulator ChaB
VPTTDRRGRPVDDELPSTVQRSADKAKRTFAKAHDSAEESYGDDAERVNRVAFSALKHTHEKVGDHWEPKEGGRRGPSDPQAAGGVDTRGRRDTHGGVDAGASRAHLYERAKELDIPGRSTMTKDQLVEALEKANARATRRARA